MTSDNDDDVDDDKMREAEGGRELRICIAKHRNQKKRE